MDIPILALDGTPIDVEVSGAAITLHGRVAVQVTARDVSARRRAEHAVRKAEEQLRHAQRLEVVGRLAGGVAHDFNNILTVIASHTSFVIDAAENRPDIRSEMLEIASATKRAADLTRQLLAFGRRQVLQPVVLDADDVVAEMVRMLRRVVPEDVRMSARRSDGQALVRVDRGQLEQVLTNLIVNARDAMASGGSLTLRTDFVDVAHGLDAMGEPIVGGSYVRIGVRDNGTGMDEITLARAFEPFFTTKPMGVGNGLGLSSVHGIVKQSGGFVTIHSALGRGTLVAVHLPRVEPLPPSTP
jgi:two-component system, cell cycle sensor histidine kinase and response regulator CckA